MRSVTRRRVGSAARATVISASSGGITGSRGHVGDNAGQAALIDLLGRGAADRSRTSVFGCPLFAAGT